jgi:hypothetical protein
MLSPVAMLRKMLEDDGGGRAGGSGELHGNLA